MKSGQAGELLRARGLSDPADVLRAITTKEICAILNFACNIRCPICPFWGTTGVSHGGADARWHAPFRPESFERFLQGMRAFGATRVNVSGGEPLASAHWREVAAISKRLGYRVTLTTNGSFLGRELERVCETVDVLQLSFTDPEEWRRGFRHADWATELERLLGAVKEAGLEITVNVAVSDASVDELEPITDVMLAPRMRVDAFRIVHPMFLAPELLAAHRADLGELGSDGAFWQGFGTVPKRVDPERLLAILKGLFARHPGRIGVFPEIDEAEVPAYYQDPDYLPTRFRHFCAAPWTQVNLIPNGDVWVCYDLVLGNIHEHDAAAIWNGPMARRLRERILERGLFAGCRGCFNKYSAIEGGTAR